MRITRCAAALALIVFPLLAFAPRGASARPVYAIKESRPCAYCHVNPNGGGERNKRGQYYAANKHSFVGYDEIKVMGRAGKPIFHAAWKETLPAGVRRVATGATGGDGKARMVLLLDGDAPGSRKVEVRKWNGSAWTTEFTDEAPANTESLLVGRYAPDQPAVIVTPGAMWRWDGNAYARRNNPKPADLLGTVIYRDGSEKLLVKQGEGLKVYGINVARNEWLTGAQDPPPSAQTVFTEMKGRTEDLKALGLDGSVASGGILGYWDAGKEEPFLYAILIQARVSSQGDKPLEGLVLKGADTYLSVFDPRVSTLKSLWKSDRLDGRVLDVSLNDPRSGVHGLAVLTESGPDHKAATLTFFQLD